MASPSGRYIAFVAPDQDRTAAGVIKAKNDTLLVDTLSGNIVVLPHSADPELWQTNCLLHFSVDEREVVGCYTRALAGPSTLSVYCYAGLPNKVHLRASGKCTSTPLRLSTGLHVSDDHKTARIISESREIQRIRLDDKVGFLDAPDEANGFPFESIFLSRDGSRWVGVYYGNDKARIQIHTVLNPNETPQCIELRRTSSLSDDNPPFITMSVDLSILVIDEDVYSLRYSKIGGLSTTRHTLKLPRELVVRQSIYNDRPPQCSVDPSNSFVVYHTQNRDNQKRPGCPDTFALFRINLDGTFSTRLQPSLPEDKFDISSQFHPSIPLLIVGFGLVSEATAPTSEDDMSNDYHAPFHVVIIDMTTMGKRAVEFDQHHPVFHIIRRSETCQVSVMLMN